MTTISWNDFGEGNPIDTKAYQKPPFVDPVTAAEALIVRFPERVRITPPGVDRDLFAIGRNKAGVVVEIEEDGRVLTVRALLSVFNHAPHIFETIDRDILESLPKE